MPTVARILQLAPAASYLAANYVDKKNFLKGGALVPNQSINIYRIYKILKHVYDKDPTYPGLQVRCDYLYELLKRWALAAAAIVDGNDGGSVAPPTPGGSVAFPFYIFSANFESDGVTYLNSKIAGVNIALFIDEYVQQFFPGTNFTYVAGGGFTITAPGFDANNFDYTIRVERYFPIPT